VQQRKNTPSKLDRTPPMHSLALALGVVVQRKQQLAVVVSL
jgi:hypothetical protein